MTTLKELGDLFLLADAALDENRKLATKLTAANLRVDALTRDLAAANVVNEVQRTQLAEQATEIERLNAELAACKNPLPTTPPAPFAIVPVPPLTAKQETWQTRFNAAFTVWKPEATPTVSTLGRGEKQDYVTILFAALHMGNVALVDRLETWLRGLQAHITALPKSNLDQLNETLLCSLLCLHALVMQSNGREWESWHALVRSRYGDTIPNDNVAHAQAATIESLHYLALLGETGYSVARDAAVKAFKAAVKIEGGIVDYDHRLTIVNGNELGSPDLNYISYMIGSDVLLDHTGLTLIDLDAFANTLGTNTLRPDGTINARLNGDYLDMKKQVMNNAKWTARNACLLATRDQRLRAFSESVWTDDSAFNIPAAMLRKAA